MTRKQSREEVDYVYNTPKKKVVPPSRKKVVKTKMIGTTLVRKVIDQDYEPLIGFNGIGIL